MTIAVSPLKMTLQYLVFPSMIFSMYFQTISQSLFLHSKLNSFLVGSSLSGDGSGLGGVLGLLPDSFLEGLSDYSEGNNSSSSES